MSDTGHDERIPDATALVTRLLDAYDATIAGPGAFTRVRDAMIEEDDFQAVAAAIGGEMGRVQLELISPEIVCDYSALAASTMDGPSVFRGHDEWVVMWRLWFEPWDAFEWTDRRIEPIDGEHALLESTGRCRGRTSGVTVEVPQTGIWTARDGKLVAFKAFDTTDQALAWFEAERSRGAVQ
jgi:hypothetical protein